MAELPIDPLAIIEGADALDLTEGFRGWRIEVIRLGRGLLPRSGAALSIDGVVVTGMHLARSVLLRGASPRNTIALFYSHPKTPALRVASRPLASDACLMLSGPAPFDIYLPEGCSLCVVSTAANLAAVANAPPRGRAELRSLPAEQRTALVKAIELLDTVRRSETPELTAARVQRTLCDRLAPRVAELFSSTVVLPLETTDKVIRRLAVQRACVYMDAHMSRAISLADLCEAAGVRSRTLEYGFREFYDVGPMTYLKSARLCRVRGDLSNARLIGGSVAAAARRWSFTHMGQFSRDYRMLFGESPSITLARCRAAAGAAPPQSKDLLRSGAARSP